MSMEAQQKKSLIEILMSGPLSTEEILSACRKEPLLKNVPRHKILDFILHLWKKGMLEKIQHEDYLDEKPITSAMWAIKRPKREILRFVSKEDAREPALWLVVSTPPPLPRLSKLKMLIEGFEETLSVDEAIDRLMQMAENELRIACPYYDAYFETLLYRFREKISKLDVRILVERANAPLIRALTYYPHNVKVREFSLYKKLEEGRFIKIYGEHAKIIIADDREALIGSMNLTAIHLSCNLDIGILIGNQPTIRKIIQIFDTAWAVAKNLSK